MDSHIQMPKCVLKQFAIKTGANQGKIYYYNFANKKICLGCPKTLNTEKDYYSNEAEYFLSAEIETPLGQIIKQLKGNLYEDKGFRLNRGFIDTILNYLYALLARSPQMAENVKESFIFKCFFSEQNIHDMSAVDSIYLMQQDRLCRDEFSPIFIVNKTDIPFVLPTCGYYDYKSSNTEEIIQIPLTENICVALLKINDWIKYKAANNNSLLFKVNDAVVHNMNNLAFITQKRYQNAYLVSSDRSELERIQSEMKNESI